VAELQVKISADTREAKKLVRSLNEIKKSAGLTAGSLEATSAAASKTSVSLKTTVSASGQLAISQNLAATANVAVAKTLSTVAAKATQTAVAEKAATTQTNFLTAAFQRMSLTGTGAFLKVSAGAKRFTTQMRTAAGSVAGMSVAAQGFGALLAVGIGVGIKAAVKLETTFSRIEGLVGIAASEVEAFKKPLNDIAKATGKGPNELAEALFFVTSAGFEGKEALDVLNASARAAAAGLGETKQVADAVTSAVNAYGIENLNAAEATDILVATVREGKAAADSIAGALGQILPSASELGIEFEELGGAIAALTRIGLGADQAATALGATMAAIQKPGDDAKKALKEFGLSASGLRKTVREEGLLAGLQQMQEAFGDNETALTRVVPNIRALRAVLPLVGRNAGNVAKIFEEVADSAGAADAAFEVYAKTTGFELDQAMVVLQTTLIKLGNDLLPSVTQAFVWFAQAVQSTVDATKNAGEFWAEVFVGGNADPVIQARQQVDLLTKAIENYESRVNFITQGALAIGGVDVGLTELSGTYDENLAKLRKQLEFWTDVVNMNKEETDEAARLNAALAVTKGILDSLEEIDLTEVAGDGSILDEKKLEKGQKALEGLQTEVAFLQGDLTHLQLLGKEGIGLQEDFEETKLIVGQLQGTVEGAAAKVRGLVNDKRALSEAIELVNEEFAKQDAATDFLDDLVMDTGLLVEKFEALAASGGNLFDIDSLQQAQAIFNDLSDEDKKLFGGPEAIQEQLILQEALNTAISAIPVDKIAALTTQLETLQMANVDPENTFFGQLGPQIAAVETGIINAALAAEGLTGLDQILLDALPKEEQFAQASLRLKKAFNLAGIVDPESNPEFIAAIDALHEKIFSTGDAMNEFAVQAARNLQSAFADFLFDPLDEGFDGMLRSFADTLKRMAAEALSQQILTSLIGGLGGSSNGFIAGIGQALGGAFADGGRVSGNEPILVGERGPELFQPGQSGNIVSNEMMRGTAQAAPTVNVAPAPVIVVDDPSKVEKALQTANGQRALVEAITEKRGSIKQALA
jgi:TP901 family phage tail tape measure protein